MVNRLSKLHNLRSLKQHQNFNKATAGVGILLFAIVGTVLIFRSRAATPFVSTEPEQGTIAGAACPELDATASGGNSVKFGAACSTGGTLNLPRIPWEGGPNYWKQFAKADAAGWDDPSFFPIGNWQTNASSQSEIDKDKAIGINLYARKGGAGEGPAYWQMSAALLRANNMFSIPEINEAGNVGSEAVGWSLTDEPSQFGGDVLQTIKNEYDRVQSASPNDGRFTYTNFTSDMVLPNYIRNTAQQELNLYNSVVSTDVYWYTFNIFCGGSAAGEIWKYGSGPTQPHGAGYNDLSPEECHRSYNYGYNMNSMQEISGRNLPAPKVPVWNFIENSHPSEFSTEPTIQPFQLEGAVMSTIINEGRGILYFNHNFGTAGITTNDPCGGDEPFRGCNNTYGNAVRASATKVNSYIKQLAPAINTQSYQWNFDSTLDTMLKEQGGSYYIFAMPGDKKGGAYTGSHTLQLPPGLNGSTVQVMFENRSLPINASRQFTDSFAAEYSYHIYKITP